MLLHPHAQLCEWRRKTLIPGVVSSGWCLLLLRQVELFSTPWTAATRPLEWLSATPPEFALRTERGTPVVPAPWPKKPNKAACIHLTTTASSHCEVKSSQSCPTP